MTAGDYGVEIIFTPTVGTGLLNFSGATAVELVTISPISKTRKTFAMTVAEDNLSASYVTQENDFPSDEYGTYLWQVQAQYGATPFIQSPARSLYVGPSV